MIDKIRIYFMGAGKIAVPLLQTLAGAESIELLGIGTQVDQRAGRKKQFRPTPVGQFAVENKLEADKIESVKASGFMDKIRALDLDFIVVVSFGQILRQELLDIPGCCCLNVHASILPEYRGASPISAAVLNGDVESGIAFMKMDKGLDTGDVYKILKMPLQGNEYADSLEKKLGDLAAENIVETLEQIKNGQLLACKQDEKQATLTSKVKKDDGEINWSLPAEKIEAMVRAYHSWPGAYFTLQGKKGQIKLNIIEARCVKDISGEAGRVLQADKKALIIACGGEALEILRLVPQGKKEMSGPAFLNGHRLSAGTKI
ncbi:MAG: methionyl-tRNA formyltransferase [Victivallales bacterium]|nr:methionyl-tRNA formyltransferase [Victivallales bacterium]